MIEIFAVFIGGLVGVGMWLLVYYGFDMSTWVSGVAAIAQWGLPIIAGLATTLTVCAIYYNKKEAKK